MAGGHVLLRYSSSRWSTLIKPFAAYLHKPVMGYSKGTNVHGMKVKAPSTAEEFERVAEEVEKVIEEKAHHQGDACHQTTEKTFDALEEATSGDSNLDSVKNKYKESSKNENYHKSGDD